MKLNRKPDPVPPVIPVEPEAQPDKTGTVLAEGVLFQGDFQSKEPMLIHGSVEGDIRSASDVTFTDRARCTGDITSENLVISGTAQGNIQCASTVELAGAGRVEGVLKAARFIMSEDSVFEGSLQIKKPGTHKKAPAPEAAPAGQKEEKNS